MADKPITLRATPERAHYRQLQEAADHIGEVVPLGTGHAMVVGVRMHADGLLEVDVYPAGRSKYGGG